MEIVLGICTIAITACIGLIVYTNLSEVKKIASKTAKAEAQKELEKIKSENEKNINEVKEKISEDVKNIKEAIDSFYQEASEGKDLDKDDNIVNKYKVKGINHLKNIKNRS